MNYKMKGEKNTISYEDFAKLDLRTAKIEKVEDIEGADKLYKLTIKIGTEKRTIVAGIKEFYSREELKGKTIIIIANLEPRKIKGIESHGMLLAAENNGDIVLLSTDKKINDGSKIN